MASGHRCRPGEGGSADSPNDPRGTPKRHPPPLLPRRAHAKPALNSRQPFANTPDRSSDARLLGRCPMLCCGMQPPALGLLMLGRLCQVVMDVVRRLAARLGNRLSRGHEASLHLGASMCAFEAAGSRLPAPRVPARSPALHMAAVADSHHRMVVATAFVEPPSAPCLRLHHEEVEAAAVFGAAAGVNPRASRRSAASRRGRTRSKKWCADLKGPRCRRPCSNRLR